MVQFLIRRFVPDYKQTGAPAVRARYGTLSGMTGIVLNLLLFAFKCLAGFISGSIAVIADAFNNLSDAGSSVVTLVGFRMAEAPADDEHPFGHGRIEYISGLVVSMAIILVGVELLKSSFDKILHPEATMLSLVPFVILLASIALKLWMSHFNRTLAGIIDSSAMRATAQDCLTDSIATAAVAAGMIISHFTGWTLDGYIGLLVALFILYAGFNTAKDSLSPLLGQTPDPEFVSSIKETVLSHPQVIGIHDLIVHDYGPGQRMVSLHAEVRADEDILVIHDVIDHIELELRARFRCEATIHMDPVDVRDEATALMRDRVRALIGEIDPALSIHDFRMVVSPSHTNLIFDVLVPHRFRLTHAQLSHLIHERVQSMEGGTFFAVIRIESGYTAKP